MSIITTRSQARAMELGQTFLQAKAQGEALGLSGGELVQFIKEKEKEERQERERREKEVREEKERERQERREKEEREREERKEHANRDKELELKRLELDAEVRKLQAEKELEEARARISLESDQNQNSNSATNFQNRRHGETFRAKLPYFDDGDDIENYLRTFERTAKFQGWDEHEWGLRIGSLLKGRAREVFTQLKDEDAQNYEILKASLLKKFHLNAEQYRQRFREAKRQQGETTREFANKLGVYIDHWIEMAAKEGGCTDLKQLFLLEKLYSGIPFDEARFIRERTPQSIEEAVGYSEVFISAKEATVADHQRPNKLPNRINPRHQEKTLDRRNAPIQTGNHQFVRGSNVNQQRHFKLKCYTCGGEHKARDCPQNRNVPLQNGRSAVAVADQVGVSATQKSTKLCEECTQIPFSPECEVLVEGKKVSALRDTGASITIVRSDLIPEQCLTNRTMEIVLAASPEKRTLAIAKIYLDSPFYVGETEVLIMDKPVFPVLIGNYAKSGEGKFHSIPVYPIKEVCASVQTREAAKKMDKVLKITSAFPGNVTPEILSKKQKEDPTLRNVRRLAESKTTVRGGRGKNSQGVATYQWKNNILYRTFQKDGREHHQVVVPKEYRMDVLRLAHDIPMSGHLGITKTKQRVWNDFVWPGICNDVKRYCSSCDICQRCTPKGSTPKVPLGKMPIIDTPFDRVAIDIIGPIIPSSERGHRYILTMVDYATRYVEAKPLKTAKSEEVAEALWEMWSRLGVPREILSDRGSQFVGDMAKEVNQLLCIRGISTTPRHAQGNGLVEKFNGTIKSMLRHLCQEQPKEWDRFVPALLFAIREVPQESLKFSPFELLFGRTLRGPMQILKELWTKEEQNDETRTTFQYVVDLRNRIEGTCKMARDNLSKASMKQAEYFNRKSKQRKFKVGDKVLILIPNKNNKLQMTWRGPYIVTDKMNVCDYKVMVGNKEKIYHANILKKYVDRLENADGHIVAVVMIDETSESVQESKAMGIPMVGLQRKEFPKDVQISEDLTKDQHRAIENVCHQYNDVLSDLPGRTNLAECDIRQENVTPIHVRQYPLPHSKINTIGEEVNSMLKLGVIEPAASPYNAPVVLVQKKDGSNRFCIDYRKLNQSTIFDAEPMPDINLLFSKLSNKKFFSKLDLTKGFWQIPMKDGDKEKTAFTTAQGQFQWTTMPFGLKNAGAVFSRMMRKLLRPLPQEAVDNFMDDVIIATDTWEEHIRVLGLVLKRLQECGLKAKPTKCYFGFKTLSFLGHEIAEGTIRPEEDKLKKIKDAQPPRTKKELRAFLGLAGYYRKFVPNFATIALPLTDKTKKGHPEHVKWDESCEKSFSTLKRKLCEKPVICMPDKDKVYTLRTDASDRGIGAVLMQDQGHGLQPVAYASRKLSETESRYATIEKECLAIVWAIRKFEPYLFGNSFVIETDHQPLQYLRKSRTENGRLMRWAIQLQQYQFVVKVIPGKDNVGADYLSRATYV